jgi:hypothetical protein
MASSIEAKRMLDGDVVEVMNVAVSRADSSTIEL